VPGGLATACVAGAAGPLARVHSRLAWRATCWDADIFGLFWRRLAARLGRLPHGAGGLRGARFSTRGGLQFEADFQGLCSAFGGATARPAAFFRRSQEAAILLSLPGARPRSWKPWLAPCWSAPTRLLKGCRARREAAGAGLARHPHPG